MLRLRDNPVTTASSISIATPSSVILGELNCHTPAQEAPWHASRYCSLTITLEYWQTFVSGSANCLRLSVPSRTGTKRLTLLCALIRTLWFSISRCRS